MADNVVHCDSLECKFYFSKSNLDKLELELEDGCYVNRAIGETPHHHSVPRGSPCRLGFTYKKISELHLYYLTNFENL